VPKALPVTEAARLCTMATGTRSRPVERVGPAAARLEYRNDVIALSESLVSIIIPTWNERENIGPLIDGIRKAMAPAEFEVVVVDDASTDGTGAAVNDEARRHSNIRAVHRPAKMGLSSAVLDGAARSTGRVVVMMDGDLSHDPGLLRLLIRQIHAGSDVAIGSRYVQGGRLTGWPLHRRLGSLVFTWSARTLFRLRVRDPLSGFAAFRREVLETLPTRFSGPGFKLLLEVLATQPSLRVSEVPITFVDRARGKSKLGASEMREFGLLCCRLLRWRMSERILSRRSSPVVRR
jgi:dolichol-phosphate mannosyltransferase